MNLIALLLGAIATFSPFFGLILALMYCSFSLRGAQVKPMQALGLVLVFPVMFAVFFREQSGSLLVASDALFGVGLAALAFLASLRRGFLPAAALANSALLVIAYGIARQFLFGASLSLANEQALAEMAKAFPQFAQTPQLQTSMALIKQMNPSAWVVSQLLALFAGFVILLRLSGAKFVWKAIHFPSYYNLAILAVLPLYMLPQLRLVFVNALVALCVLPIIQGVGVVSHFIARHTSNVILMVLATLLIIFNLFLVALLGFADIWLNFRKLNLKGTTV